MKWLLALLSSASLAAPVVTQVTYPGSPVPAVPGTVVQIIGSGFTGTTGITVGAISDGSFTVVSDTEIDWTVPIDGPPGGNLSIFPGGANLAIISIQVYSNTPPLGAMCLPTQSSFKTQVNPSTGNTVVTLWCDLTSGLYHYSVSGNTVNWQSAKCLSTIEPFSVSTLWLQHAWAACVDHVMNPSDMAFSNRLLYMWIPRPTVLGTQPVRTLNADGTLGSQLSISGVPQTIASTAVGGLRLASGTVSPRYCDVSKFSSVQGAILPSLTYALCTVVYPPLSGFQYPTSDDGVSLQFPTEAFLVDSSHHVWTIDSKSIITVDGIEDASSPNVTALVWVGGLIWKRDQAGLWWSKTGAQWIGGTTTSPI